MKSNIFTINLKDAGHALISAFFVGAFLAVEGVVSQAGFSIFSANWSNISQVALNGGVIAFLAVIGQKFISTPDGKVLGVIG